MKNLFYILAATLAACSTSNAPDNQEGKLQLLILKNAKAILGDSNRVIEKTDILIQDGHVTDIGPDLKREGAEEVDLLGKTVMPALISTHVHVGTLKGTTSVAANYTRENILDQMNKYAAYGVLHVQVMGTDRPLLFQNGLYDSIKNGFKDGARMLSAGYGFNTPQANVDPTSFLSLLYRPTSASQVPAEIDSLAALGIKTVKIWVDDFNKTQQKMDVAIYRTVIEEAHKKNMKVAAHLYNLTDARNLVTDGIDIIAHSIRDSVVDDALLALMKAKNITYIPTLVLDKFAYAYAGDPEWINDPFFKASLEPGVYEMITAEKYKTDTRNSPGYARNENGYKIAAMNAKKIADYGIRVALGTDSGAFPVRTQGFSEHLEMQLLVEAGIDAMQVLTIATRNGADALGLNNYGSIQTGNIADLLVLDGDPVQDIKNSRKIAAVYKKGVKIK